MGCQGWEHAWFASLTSPRRFHHLLDSSKGVTAWQQAGGNTHATLSAAGGEGDLPRAGGSNSSVEGERGITATDPTQGHSTRTAAMVPHHHELGRLSPSLSLPGFGHHRGFRSGQILPAMVWHVAGRTWDLSWAPAQDTRLLHPCLPSGENPPPTSAVLGGRMHSSVSRSKVPR